MRRYDLTDEQWDLIVPLFAEKPHPKGGRPFSPARRTFNGVMWILCTGAPWRDLPSRFGSWKTVYGRFRRWRREGTIEKALRFLQMRLNEKGLIDWSTWMVDGTSIRASRVAAGARKKGGLHWSPRTTRWGGRAEALARSSSSSPTRTALSLPLT